MRKDRRERGGQKETVCVCVCLNDKKKTHI